MCRYKPQSRRVDQAIKHPDTRSLTEFSVHQDQIYPINSVPGPLWAGWHGISVITLDPCRLSPWNLVRIQAWIKTDRSSHQASRDLKNHRIYSSLWPPSCSVPCLNARSWSPAKSTWPLRIARWCPAAQQRSNLKSWVKSITRLRISHGPDCRDKPSKRDI